MEMQWESIRRDVKHGCRYCSRYLWCLGRGAVGLDYSETTTESTVLSRARWTSPVSEAGRYMTAPYPDFDWRTLTGPRRQTGCGYGDEVMTPGREGPTAPVNGKAVA